MASNVRIATLVPIKNMNRAIKFFSKSLGGRLMERGQGQMKNFWASMHIGNADFWLVGNTQREKRKLAYTTLLVKDIKRYVKGLQGKRVKFEKAERMGPDTRIEGPVAFESFGASAFFKDSEGNLWMVWQNFPAM